MVRNRNSIAFKAPQGHTPYLLVLRIRKNSYREAYWPARGCSSTMPIAHLHKGREFLMRCTCSLSGPNKMAVMVDEAGNAAQMLNVPIMRCREGKLETDA